jgi:hypothetical protein
MEGQFLINYKTRLKLQRAIQMEIRNSKSFVTWTMHDSIRVASATGDLNKLYITVSAIYYFMFLDKGAILPNGGEIRPHFFIQQALQSNQGKAFLQDAVDLYLKWMNKKYPILDVATINVTPDNLKVIIKYNLFGDDGGAWNGEYNYDTHWHNW